MGAEDQQRRDTAHARHPEGRQRSFSSSVLSSCTITAAPTKAVNVVGKYSSTKGTDTVSKAKITVKGIRVHRKLVYDDDDGHLLPEPRQYPARSLADGCSHDREEARIL